MNFFNFVLLFLTFPFTFPISPFITILSYTSLVNDCNEIVSAKINKISNIDSFQCSLDAYIMKYDVNVTLPPINCMEFMRCRQLLKHNSDACTTVTLKMNHLYREKSCIDIIMSDWDIRGFWNYKDTSQWLMKGIVEFIFLIIFICMPTNMHNG
jgi:hypothetical protein